MSYMCPVCNGLFQVDARCPKCHSMAIDNGKHSDFFDPYSPYRSIDDLKMSDGFADLEPQQCIHMYHCPSCGNIFTEACPEQKISP